MNPPRLNRLGVMLAVFVLAFMAIGVRLIFLQVRDAEALQSMAIDQRVRTVPLPASRGDILDRSGRHFALSVDAKGIYADQRYVTDPLDVATQLAPLLKVKVGELAKDLRGDDSFVYLARQVDRGTAADIAALELAGIGALDESARHYPAGATGAPHVVGFVDTDGNGLGGLELQYDDLLSGIAGERTIEVDPMGRQIPQGIDQERPPEPGRDVVTTIDQQLQYQAQVALADAVKAERAKGGTLIAMNPRTGEVYAMASYPDFDPGDIRPRDEDHLGNPALQSVFEPGSVNKVITAAAAVEEGSVGLKEPFHVADSITRSFPDGDVTVSDSHPHGVMRMFLADIIAQSSNVGTIMVADRVGDAKLASYLAKFGFGMPTGLEFPGESRGIVAPLWEWSGASMLNIPIGQGVSVTPMQMAGVYATIANEGVWVEPTLVQGSVDAAGTFHRGPVPERRRVVSPETAETVTGMLAMVVDSGTGGNAEIPGYWVAGKTGTAEKADGEGGYSKEYMASFIGFLPAEDPQLVVLAVIDDPASEYGGEAAAPLFQRFSKEAIARLRIPAGDRPSFPPSALGR